MEADRLLGWLLEQEPSLTLQWLQEMVEGTRPLPEGFSWHALAECATFNTFRKAELSSPPHLGWAKVAALAYTYVIHEDKHSARLAHNPDMEKISYLSLEVALITLQARCIIAFGSVAGDPVLDIQQPITCFFEDLPFSPDEVLKIYAHGGKEHTPKVHRDLVRIRKKLAVLQLLQEKRLLPPDQNLLLWFSVWDQTHF